MSCEEVEGGRGGVENGTSESTTHTHNKPNTHTYIPHISKFYIFTCRGKLVYPGACTCHTPTLSPHRRGHDRRYTFRMATFVEHSFFSRTGQMQLVPAGEPPPPPWYILKRPELIQDFPASSDLEFEEAATRAAQSVSPEASPRWIQSRCSWPLMHERSVCTIATSQFWAK